MGLLTLAAAVAGLRGGPDEPNARAETVLTTMRWLSLLSLLYDGHQVTHREHFILGRTPRGTVVPPVVQNMRSCVRNSGGLLW